MHTILQFENLKGRDRLEDLGIDGKIMFEWILGKEAGRLTGYVVVALSIRDTVL